MDKQSVASLLLDLSPEELRDLARWIEENFQSSASLKLPKELRTLASFKEGNLEAQQYEH